MVIEFRIQRIQQNKSSHSHRYGQFVIPYRNCVFIDVDDQSYVIDENSIGYISPDTIHRYSSDKGVDALVININEQMVKESERYTLEHCSPFMMDEKMLSVIHVIKDEVASGRCSEPVKYLFFYIYDRIVETRRNKSVAYIHDNYQYDIPLQTLADLEHYSPKYFTEWFKKMVGIPPMTYLKKVRIEKAKDLLMTTGYNLTQIAIQVGYNQSSTMCKVFKELEGCTPKEFRKRNS